MNSTPFLPLGLLPQIVKYLPYRETANLCLVSKAFRQWVVDGRCFLHELDFSQDPLTDRTISHITSLTNLASLILDCNELSSKIFKLSSLTQLQELYAFDGNISNMPHFPNLRKLDLEKNNPHGFNIESIESLTTLIYLDVSDLCFNEKLLNLKQLTKLQTLYLANSRITSIPKSLLRMPFLEGLDLSENHLPDLSLLSHLTRLNWLGIINSCSMAHAMNVVTKLTGLKELFLGNKYTSDDNSNFNGFRSLTKLRELNRLAIAPVESVNLQHFSTLGELISLTWLNMADIPFTPGTSLSHPHAADVSFLTRLTSLKTLIVSKTWSKQEHCGIFGKLTGLRCLNISNNNIGNEGIASISSLTNLQILYAADCNLTNRAVGVLTHLTSLTSLNLEKNRITYMTASKLKSLPHLSHLNIANNYIDEDEYECFDREVKRIKLS